jgi:hypothetical protein
VDRIDYDYRPRPAIFIPPVGPSFLAHHFHSRHLGQSQQVLDSLPKLVDAREFRRLIYNTDDKHQKTGWGIEVREGFYFTRIFSSLACYLCVPITILVYCQELSWYFRIGLLLWLFFPLTIILAYYKITMQDTWTPLIFQIRIARKEDIPPASVDALLSAIVPIVRQAYARWHNVLTYGLRWFQLKRSRSNYPGRRITCQVSVAVLSLSRKPTVI